MIPPIILSPFREDTNAVLKKSLETITIRGDKVEAYQIYYECKETKEQFTTTELSEINAIVSGRIWKSMHSIPWASELFKRRFSKGLSLKEASKQSGIKLQRLVDLETYDELMPRTLDELNKLEDLYEFHSTGIKFGSDK